MKLPPVLLACCLGLVFTSRPFAADATPPTNPAVINSPFTPLAYLAGHTRAAALPPTPDGTVTKIELRCDWAKNRRALRFDSEVVQGDKRIPYTSGLYAWHPAKRKLVFLYADSDGSLHEGAVTGEGARLVQDFTIAGADGKTIPWRSVLTRLGDEAFTNEISQQKDGKWEKFVEVRYERLP